MTENQITLDQVKAAAAEVVAENPDAVNPMLGPLRGCAYTKPKNDKTPNAAEHCIGGTVLLKLGLGLPREGTTVVTTPDKDKLEPRAMGYIRSLQFAADGFADRSFGPGGDIAKGPIRTWSEAFEVGSRRFNDGSWAALY